MADNGINFGDFPEYFYTVLNPNEDFKTVSIDEASIILAENAGIKLRLNRPGEPIRYSTNTDSSETLAVFRFIAKNLPNQFLQKQTTDTGFVSPLQYLNVAKLIRKLNTDPNWLSIQKTNNLSNLESLYTEVIKSEGEKIKSTYVGSEAAKQKLLNEYKNNDSWFNFEGIQSVKIRNDANDISINPTGTNNPIENLPPATTPDSAPTATTVPPTEVPATESGTTTTTTVPGTTPTGAPDLWGDVLGSSVFDEQKWLQENTGATLAELEAAGNVDQTFDISGLPSSFKSGIGTEFSDKTKLTLSATLRYPYQLNKQGIMDLQDNLRRAGWFDRVGKSFGQHGVYDDATAEAFQTFMADSVRAGIPPATMLRDGLTNYVRNRAAEAGVVYRDNVALDQTIRSLGENLIGRGLTTQESDSLVQQIRRWEETAALGPTFAQDNYQVDIDAKAQNAIETQFKAQYMTQTISDALRKAGKA